MGDDSWLPIDPNLTAGGAFAALAHLPNAAALKPRPLPPGAALDTHKETGASLDVRLAAKLGISGIVDATMGYQMKTLTWHHAVYREVQDLQQPPSGGLILGTRWGAGLRVRVTYSVLDVSLAGGLPAIAMAASLGLVQASYEVVGFGVSDPALLAELPNPGRFDPDTYRAIQKAVAGVESEFLVPKKGIVPVPFMIFVTEGAFASDRYDRARSLVHGVRQLAWKNPLRVALERRDKTMDPMSIRGVYARLAPGAADDQGPTPAAIAKASEWLETSGL